MDKFFYLEWRNDKLLDRLKKAVLFVATGRIKHELSEEEARSVVWQIRSQAAKKDA